MVFDHIRLSLILQPCTVRTKSQRESHSGLRQLLIDLLARLLPPVMALICGPPLRNKLSNQFLLDPQGEGSVNQLDLSSCHIGGVSYIANMRWSFDFRSRIPSFLVLPAPPIKV